VYLYRSKVWLNYYDFSAYAMVHDVDLPVSRPCHIETISRDELAK